jgi:hypothetical protein
MWFGYAKEVRGAAAELAPFPKDQVWKNLPPQELAADSREKAEGCTWSDAYAVARDSGMGGPNQHRSCRRVSSSPISGVLPREEAIQPDQKGDREKNSNGKTGEAIVQKDYFAAVRADHSDIVPSA